MTFLVNGLMDFAKLKSGNFRKDINNFDIRKAILDIMQAHREKADFCGIDQNL